MKLRTSALLGALIAVVGSLAIAGPAQAATTNVTISTTVMALTQAASGKSYGTGKVFATCKASTKCTGIVSISGTGAVGTSYSIPAKSSKYIAVKVGKTQAAYPFESGVSGLNTKSAQITINETKPSNHTHAESISVEKIKKSATITGTIKRLSGDTATDLEVTLMHNEANAGVIPSRTVQVSSTGKFSLTVGLGTNNSPSQTYQLRVRGTDGNGNRQSWFWRGTSGHTSGGSKYLSGATTFRVTKNDFVADFPYGAISGTVSTSANGHQVTVAAPPPSYSSNASTQRELDIAGCADIYGTDTVSAGHYSVGFLPVDTVTSDRRYMVSVDAPSGSTTMFYGSDTRDAVTYSDCFSTMKYARSRDNLISISPSGSFDRPVTIRAATGSITSKVTSVGFNKTYEADRWTDLRAYVPGRAVLNSTIVQAKHASTTGVATFTGVAPGRYWVETGRRTGCTDWFPSVYPNNSAYFQGLDRGAESWKAFPKLSSLSSAKQKIALANGATQAQQGHVPSGYKGWMYREVCVAHGAGHYTQVTIGQAAHTVSQTVHDGATISGHVTRAGGRSNKEVLVSAYSTAGKLAMRTTYTNGSGNFTLKGLASGTYRIEVNSDSWRGLDRIFTGPHSKTVKAGHAYTVGTLHLYKGTDTSGSGD